MVLCWLWPGSGKQGDKVRDRTEVVVQMSLGRVRVTVRQGNVINHSIDISPVHCAAVVIYIYYPQMNTEAVSKKKGTFR